MKLKKRINPEVSRKLKDAVFVGRLVREDELAATPIDEPVYFKNEYQDDIQFHIKCLSPIPDELSQQFYFPNKIITGGTRSRNNQRKLNEWIDYDRIYHFEKKEKLQSLLEDKLIVFTVSFSTEYVYVELMRIEEDLKPAEKGYQLIPGPQLSLKEEKKDFEDKLVNVRRPFTLRNYPNLFETPEFIYYQGSLYEVALNPSQNATTYTQQDSREVTYIENFEDRFMDIVDARVDENLYFISGEDFLDLRDEMKEHGQSLNSKIEYEETRDEVEEDQEEDKDPKSATYNTASQQKFNKGEIEFINRLKANAKRKGLYYKDDDLYAFHISVKTNLLSIIGGMSGTGKSRLAQLYGETMGLQYAKELLMIPISPSYHEPNDILGYLNPTTGVYHEGDTGLVQLLLDAEETPEKMFMVIFDEMNLSQVEYWFSPFISLLEIDGDNRYLTLFNENSHCVNNKYKPKVKIGKNIIFVGTVNFDETTKNFSDRLLDRTNVLMPSKLSFQDSLSIARSVENTEDIEPFNVHTSKYREDWVKKEWRDQGTQIHALKALKEDEIKLLDGIHELLNQDDMQKGVSFRVALGISRFIDNIPLNEDGVPLIEREKAFDIQVKQRILTKIKGFESYAEPLVGSYDEGVYSKGRIAELLTSEAGQQVSSFTECLSILQNKAKELMTYGFTN